ncbi:hypothetical protein RF55_8913 [Lasius niger]|uniref:Uncharacterized protein n=1 Tax=Lasius niger TaxID=67767 RepID=A0A0J7KLT0_LASNI|nr:hypothetical protein RF55_8913 [Lasius niger]
MDTLEERELREFFGDWSSDEEMAPPTPAKPIPPPTADRPATPGPPRRTPPRPGTTVQTFGRRQSPKNGDIPGDIPATAIGTTPINRVKAANNRADAPTTGELITIPVRADTTAGNGRPTTDANTGRTGMRRRQPTGPTDLRNKATTFNHHRDITRGAPRCPARSHLPIPALPSLDTER